MTKYLPILPLPNREPVGQGANGLLVLGVAAFVLGVMMVSRGVLLSPPAAHLIPTTPTALGRVESLVNARDESPLTTTPPADRVSPVPMTSTASSSRTQSVAVCPPRRALECDLRLGLMEMALQQRGRFLGLHVAPYVQDVPRKYCLLPRADASVAHAAASPHLTPQPQEPGC